jgi:hypothetical protein
VPVFNVSMELMRKSQASALPFREFEIRVATQATPSQAVEAEALVNPS